MIRRPNNWNEVQEFTNRPKLPNGAYVCRIKKAVIQSTSGNNDLLCILFDIIEGEYKDFYSKDFEANTSNDKKWRGVLRYWLPIDDGSENGEITKRKFKGLVTSLEKSNQGYVFDWNENSMAGKIVGVLFRNEEWEMNGKTGWAVRPFCALSVDTVRSGEYTLPNDKPLKTNATASAASVGAAYGSTYVPSAYSAPAPQFEAMSGDDDLPF